MSIERMFEQMNKRPILNEEVDSEATVQEAIPQPAMNEQTTKKTNITQYLELVNPQDCDGSEIVHYGCYYRVPKTGITDELIESSTVYKYNFETQEVILVSTDNQDFFKKKVPFKSFLCKPWRWLSVMRAEARLLLNLDEGKADSNFYGVINEEGMVEVNDTAEIISVDRMAEELNGNYTVTDDCKVYRVNEDLNEEAPEMFAPYTLNGKYYLTGEKHGDKIEYWDEDGKYYEMDAQKFAKKFKRGTAKDLERFED